MSVFPLMIDRFCKFNTPRRPAGFPGGKILFTALLLLLLGFQPRNVRADGGYFSYSESVTISTDQRAILIHCGDTVSMTVSTAYTGDGEDFAWIIPVPAADGIIDVFEPGNDAEDVFGMLEKKTAPVVITETGGGCFPAGTPVITADGPVPIEKVDPGEVVAGFDFSSNRWIAAEVLYRETRLYRGELIALRTPGGEIHTTANHPFFVMHGNALDDRPLPGDVPPEDRQYGDAGRWVEAGDLKPGDLLAAYGCRTVAVTGITRSTVQITVYNLTVKGCNTYAAGPDGLLVHNKGGVESQGGEHSVTLLRRKTLEHYTADVVSAVSGSGLISWLRDSGYSAAAEAESVLEDYISRGWIFTAVKFVPGERRRYDNEFLKPLTLRYKTDRLVFPLRISSVSSAGESRLSLYLLDRRPVSASNFRTVPLRYEHQVEKPIDPFLYISGSMKETLKGGADVPLVVFWKGRADQEIKKSAAVKTLGGDGFTGRGRIYITRLETVLPSSAMNRDIEFTPDRKTEAFTVSINAGKGYYSQLVQAAEEGSIETVRELLADGMSPDARNMKNETALTKSAEAGNDAVLRLLISSGADINNVDASGNTPLKLAARYAHPSSVDILLEKGADPDGSSGRHDATALMEVSGRGCPDIVKQLLNAGADVNFGSGTSMTALMNAVNNGDAETTQILLQAGADVNTQYSIGTEFSNRGRSRIIWTPLSLALRPGNPQVVRLLLEAGADTETKLAYGSTVLIEAAAAGSAEIVRLLLDAGADIHAKDKNGLTAFKAAISGGHRETAELLRRAGADE